MIGIYKITSPSGRVYIGQSVDLENRFKQYRGLYAKVERQTRLYNSFKKYGVNNHTFEVIEECSVQVLNERERYWQEYYDVLDNNKGLNCRYTKTNDKSGKVSEQTLLKMSEAQKGEKHSRYGLRGVLSPLWGFKHSEETKSKISKGLLGQKRSQEFKNNRTGIKNPNYGIPMSEIQKQKLSEKALEKYKTTDHPRNKIVIDLETGIYFKNAKECSCFFNLNYATLKSRLNRNKNENRFKYI